MFQIRYHLGLRYYLQLIAALNGSDNFLNFRISMARITLARYTEDFSTTLRSYSPLAPPDFSTFNATASAIFFSDVLTLIDKYLLLISTCLSLLLLSEAWAKIKVGNPLITLFLVFGPELTSTNLYSCSYLSCESIGAMFAKRLWSGVSKKTKTLPSRSISFTALA